MKEDNVVDFQEVMLDGESAFVGRQNGSDYKKKLQDRGIDFEQLEKVNEEIIVKIPDNIISMNKSFFLAIWADRVLELGEENFKKKYHFQTTDHIREKINRHIQAALLTVSAGSSYPGIMQI